MDTKLDVFVKAGELDRYFLTLPNLDCVVHRFADENDGAQHVFGIIVRTCRTPEDALQLIEQSKKQRYMGRKRHRWFGPTKPEAQS